MNLSKTTHTVCMCVYVRVSVCVCVSMCVCVHMWKLEVNLGRHSSGSVSLGFLLLFFR